MDRSSKKLYFYPHCNSNVCKTIFFAHKKLYYNKKTNTWRQSEKFNVSDANEFVIEAGAGTEHNTDIGMKIKSVLKSILALIDGEFVPVDDVACTTSQTDLETDPLDAERQSMDQGTDEFTFSEESDEVIVSNTHRQLSTVPLHPCSEGTCKLTTIIEYMYICNWGFLGWLPILL